MTDTEFNAVKAFLSAYRYTELDLRVRRAELTRLTARKEALILEGNTDLLFHLEHAICAAKDAIRVLCTRQAEIEAAIDTVESAALREILTQHYICALDLKEIAERMHYSDRHIRRLRAGWTHCNIGQWRDPSYGSQNGRWHVLELCGGCSVWRHRHCKERHLYRSVCCLCLQLRRYDQH